MNRYFQCAPLIPQCRGYITHSVIVDFVLVLLFTLWPIVAVIVCGVPTPSWKPVFAPWFAARSTSAFMACGLYAFFNVKMDLSSGFKAMGETIIFTESR